ncbi:hypothetical protein LSTR_LSTR002911 [Laodelphax striatellus]|uniref:Uncharacterized protein n=1 Tax=Laodelphax striatellus TaxID=195883 RepID=A0A482XMI1_LAOST|nr:hypothetical protein LSTR_LSTR002911 [Laodelphax striatellus]
MVCVPCFMIPFLLIVWRILQPFILRFWNPWEVTDKDGKKITKAPFNCVNCKETTDEDGNTVLECPISKKPASNESETHIKSS